MTVEEIYNHLQSAFPEAGLAMDDFHPKEIIRIPAALLLRVCRRLWDDPALAFDCLMCLSGLEMLEQYFVVYHLYSMKYGHKITLRCGDLKNNEVIVPSVSSVWPTAEWHEREAYDFFGIRFSDHPDHRRILCPDDWEGYPLRKDYVPPDRWHNIPLTSILPNQSTGEGGGDE